ncbi:EGF-like domain-containing protein [Entamoeba marina]
MLLILFVCYIVIASVCDEKSDGYYCDNGVLTKCEFGDIIFQVSCALGCNDTSPLTTTCKGTSSCIYGYPGSFCEHSKLSDNSFKSSITVCHRNGLQQQFQCLNDCEQVTNSFARCKPTQNCYGVETTSKTLGYCPTPTNPIHENVKFNFPLSDALVRELHNELQLISPRCSLWDI